MPLPKRLQRPKLILNPPKPEPIKPRKVLPRSSTLAPLADNVIIKLEPKEKPVEPLPSESTQVEETKKPPGTLREPPRWKKLYEPKQTFYIAKYKPLASIDPKTVRWIRNAADERAAQEGMRFSERRGQYVVDWVERYCRLYEDSAFVRAGSPLLCEDWQYEYFMQLFGWQYHSEEFGSWIRRFTHAGIWIAKKNAKSPTLAATGLYMLIGDGEQGQKCYSVARDGKQAKIAHNHAIEMVKMSPELQAECKINHTEGIIKHVPSTSIYSVVHGDNSLSTEGFNGSLFCDETHVLEQHHMDRLKRAGISRKEPLHIEVSTAGNNADGYGYNRYNYGKRIFDMESPEDYNPNFLFIDFSVDQKVSLDKLRSESYVMSIAEPCNPSLGRILPKAQFVSDWRDSCLSETELRQFAMYRLNLWLKDSASWIELGDWLACADSPISRELERQYTLEDLMSYPCVGGLDFSKTRDMTALTLMFAVPDEDLGIRPYTWTWHWLPEPTAAKYRRFIDLYKEEYRPTKTTGGLQLIKQKTIDHEHIARRLEWVRENFDLRSVAYDTFNASECLRYLTTEHGWGEDMFIKVAQQMRYMGPITKEVERWIIRHEVHHASNSILDWQFQHVTLDTDRLGNYRPIKPDKDDYRKIDGIISLLLAACALCSDESIYHPKMGSILLFDREQSTKEGQTSRLRLQHEAKSFQDYIDD